MSSSRSNAPRHPATRTAQLGHFMDPTSAAPVPPLQPSTTFARGPGYSPPPVAGYARDHHPNLVPLEALLGELECGEGAMAFNSGLSAATALFMALEAGAHVVVQQELYWGLRSWLMNFAKDWGLEITFVADPTPEGFAAAVRPGQTRLVWIETPSNPSWKLVDIAGVAGVAKEAGALLAVDSTCATPVLTRPLELGADFVMHSATKYLNGHSDVLAGVLVTKADGPLWQKARRVRTETGLALPAFEAWLLMRGLRTLFVRVRQQCQSALALARHFAGHPKLEGVLYPGLDTHPGHAVAAQQMEGGFGGMLSLLVKGDRQATLRVVDALEVFLPATSLGGVESLVEHRQTIEAGQVGSEVPDNLLRLSIGIEQVEDLIADIEQALQRI